MDPWARLKTLPLAIAPVLIGASLAWRDAGERRVAVAVLCGSVALLLQIAANFANDYSDGIRGTDAGRAIAGEQLSRGPARLVASGVNPKKCWLQQESALWLPVYVGWLLLH